jgi:hypothetical protein
MSTHQFHRGMLGALACLIATATSVHADSIFTQRTKINGAGDLGRMKIVREVRISQDKERAESTIEFSGTAARDVGAKPVDTIEFVRLDQGLVMTLDSRGRTFTERSLPDSRAYLQELAAEADTSTGCVEAPGASPVVTVKSSAETRRIGMWDAMRTRITSRTEVVDLQTGAERNAEVVMDLWMATNIPGTEEIRGFETARASRLGLASETFPALAGLAGGFQRSMEKIRDAYATLPGYPVRWTWTVRTDLSSQDRAALADAAKLQEEGADPNQMEEETEDAADLADPLAGVATRSPESARDKNLPHPIELAAGENLTTTSADQEVGTERGATVLFRAESDLESATAGPVDPAAFEIPSGFARARAPIR